MQIKLTSTRGIRLALGLLLAVVLNAHAQSSLTNGLVAYYPFNGNANDESGLGNNGTVSNAVLSTDRFGSSLNGYSFAPELQSQISVASGFIPSGTEPMTVSFWMNIENPSLPGGGGFNKYPVFCVRQDYQTSWNFNLVFQGNGTTFTPNTEIFTNSVFQGGYGVWSLFPSFSSATNWHHFSLAFGTNNDCVFYLDGTPINPTPASITNYSRPQGTWYIGGFVPYPGGTYFSGRLDDFRIYNRALSPNEVAQLYAFEADTPVITAQPQGQTVPLGGAATFSVTATAAHALSYQWLKDGVALANATNATLILTSIQPGQIGYYSVAVSNALTGVSSANAALNLTGYDFSQWQGLVAYYPFNGSAKDASGFGDNGTNYQAVLASDRHGQTNQAYVFDNGQLNTIETVGANIPRGLGAQTFSIWFKQSPNVVGDFLHAPLFSVWSGQPADKCFRVEFWGNSLQIWDGGAGYYKVFSGPNLPMTDCQWHHLVCVVTTNGISAFFDSRTVLWSTVPPSPTNRWDLPAGSFWIGYEQGAYYDGDLDDVRVYNRALSPAEVLQLYASEAPTTNGMPAIL